MDDAYLSKDTEHFLFLAIDTIIIQKQRLEWAKVSLVYAVGHFMDQVVESGGRGGASQSEKKLWSPLATT
jgi:hypothetical protein